MIIKHMNGMVSEQHLIFMDLFHLLIIQFIMKFAGMVLL